MAHFESEKLVDFKNSPWSRHSNKRASAQKHTGKFLGLLKKLSLMHYTTNACLCKSRNDQLQSILQFFFSEMVMSNISQIFE